MFLPVLSREFRVLPWLKSSPIGSLIAATILLVSAVHATDTISNPYSGMVRHNVSTTVNGRSVTYQVVVLNLLDPNLSFFLTPSNGALPYETTRQTTKNFASAYGTALAINAHFFDTSLSPYTDLAGIAASNGDVYSPFETVGGLAGLNISVDNFAETVTGVSGGTTFASSSATPYTTLGTGSLLYQSGTVWNTGATDYRARTEIGVSRDGATMMVFATGSGMTEQECAGILVSQFGAFNVHGFDGGGSTTMVLNTGGSQSIIAIESGSQRDVGSNLGIFAGPYVAGIPDTMSWDSDSGTAGIQQGGGTWNFSSNNWSASGVNRTWANPKTPILGAGGGASISLGGNIGVTNMSVGGGYTLGTVGGFAMTLLGDLTTTGTSPTTINAPLGNSTSFTKKGSQTLVLGSSSRISMLNMQEGTIDLSGQTLTIIDPLVPMTLNGGVIQNGSIILYDPAPELSAPSGSTMLNVNFSAAKITKTGAGTVMLGGTVAWTGALTVNGGTLGLSASATLPTTAVTITSGLLDLNGANGSVTSLTLGGVAGAATAVATGSGTLTLAGNVTYDATNNPGGATLSGQLGLNANRAFAVNDSSNVGDDLTVSAAISGAFTLSKTGAGTLVLSGSNTFTSLTVSDGTVRCGADNTLPNGTLTLTKGLVDLAGFNDTVGAIKPGGVAGMTPEIRTGTGLLTMGADYTYSATNNGLGALIKGRIDLGSSTRTFTIGDSVNAVTDTSIAADLSGTVGMIKAGAGTLELGGNLSFAGLLTVNNGVLNFSGSDSTLGSITMGGVANVSAVLDTGTTTLSLTGTLAYSSGNNGLGSVMKGRLDFGSSLRTLTINNSSNAAVDMRIEAGISGSGGFAKGGPGTLELAGSNTLTGPISISAGVLRLSHVNALGNAPSLTFTAGSTVDPGGLAGSTLAVGSAGLTVSGVGTVSGNLNLSAGRITSAGGTFAVSGDMILTGGTTEITVGTTAGNFAVTGSATLGGTLKVNMSGASLTGTQTKVLLTASSISGTFSNVILPASPNGTAYSVAVQGNQLVFLVAPAVVSPPVVSPGQSATGTKGVSFSYQVVANNSPTSYALSGGALPAGVTLNTVSGLLSGTPTASGTFQPGFTATNAGGTSASQSMLITIYTAYESWLNSKGLSSSTSPGSDGDHDGWNVLEEYVLGGNPAAPDSGLTLPGLSGNTLQIKFALNISASDVTIEVQSSPDLASWTSILTKTNGGAWSGPASYTQGAAVGGIAPMTVNDTVSGSGPRFLRLKISKP